MSAIEDARPPASRPAAEGAGGMPPNAGGPAGSPPGIDPISGALNLAAFMRDYHAILAAGEHEQLALWFMDIRNFRSVNPKFGYAAGNSVLQTVHQGVRKFLCGDLPVARLGGDRFAVLTAGMDFDEASEAFDELAEFVDAQSSADGVRSPVALCAGVYYLRESDLAETGHVQALDYASVAHRKAHDEAGSHVSLFSEEDLERDMRRIAIEQAVRAALVDGQIQVWFQPQIDYTRGEIVGAEALARWKHPELGWISPAEFIPVLENCGKIHMLDLFIWEEACRCAGRWRDAGVNGGKPLPISVNVSRREMFEPGLLEHFLELQEKYELPVGSLHLEVTESAFVEEAERLTAIIDKMRANKMTIEMDDFGSGLSSLNMLKDIPVDVVKLDMGFIRSSVGEERGGVVLGSVIRMLQGLETPIIAEGVETADQAEMLKNMGCHLMQGYYFSRPMPLGEFEEFVETCHLDQHLDKLVHPDFRLEDLTNFDASSSYLFNHVMGGTMLFFAGDGTSESILVNDEFYRECGLKRSDFGNAKINPIEEISPETRAGLWKAAMEAREHGASVCEADVRLTKRHMQFVMRYIGMSARGPVYSLNVVRSRALDEDE